MKRFVEGVARDQGGLFPAHLEDFVSEDNPVRVVDVFVDALDLRRLGFVGVDPHATGRPSYHPAVLLKLYIYGYLNRVQSSRRLEREAGRNVELMWLTGRLAPDHKTIADFRKDHGAAIQQVCAQFVELCRRLDLFTGAPIAIDGAKFKAVNTRDKNFTKAKMKRRMEQIDESVARYLQQLDTADRQEPSRAQEMKTERLQEKIDGLRQEMRRLKTLEVEMLAAPDEQISLTDPDARSMATSGRGTGMVGYNVQIAVDADTHLIVAHKVTNEGHDRGQLSTTAMKAKEALRTDTISVLADRGYFESWELFICSRNGVTATLPKPLTSGAKFQGRFDRADFRYVAERDVYVCPADEDLIHRFSREENGRLLHRYWSSNCQTCALKSQCTPAKERKVSRWEHEDVLEAVERRLDENPDAMRIRRQTAEHPSGTIKSWMGYTHFQMRRLKNVRTEMALHVLAFNLKRVMNMMGVAPLAAAMRA